MEHGLIIVGAGSMGRETYQYASELLTGGHEVAFGRIVGFVDLGPDSREYLSGFGLEYEFLDPLDAHRPREDCVYVTAVGNCAQKVRAVEILGPHVHWTNVVHPSAYVAPSARLGTGIVLAPFTYVGLDCELGDHVTLNAYASTGHDSQVGACTILSPYAAITGCAVLEDEVFLGMHAAVVPRTRVGRRSNVAAGAVVTRDVPAGSLVAGNPAKGRIMYRLEDA